MVARLARDSGIPVTLLSGAVEFDPALEAAFDGCFSIQPGPVSLDYAQCDALECRAAVAGTARAGRSVSRAVQTSDEAI
jgi:hypothetical protein